MAKQLVDINGLQAKFSLNKDLSPYDMPPHFFTEAQNVRFLDGKAGKILGHSQVLGTPTAAPYWAINWLQGTTDLWIYGGATELYQIDGSTHSTVTRTTGGSYTTIAGTTNNWHGGILGGVLVVTNGLDVPQSFTQAGTDFTDLSDWPSTLRCKAIVPFKNHLVALNLTDSSTEKPFDIRWSDAIPAGASTNGANTWNTASTASESAQVSLSGTKGHVLNGLQLGNELMIYKEDSVYGLTYVGGNFTFRIREVFKDTGMLARDGVVDLGNGSHVFLATNDVLMHNGTSIRSVIDNHMKTFLFNEIDSTYYYKTFLTHNKLKTEVWICFPQTGAINGLPDTALIWNYREDTWTIRELPNVNFIAKGEIDPGTTNTWAATTTAWQDEAFSWATQEYNPSVDSLLMCGTNDTKLYMADLSTKFDGTNFTMLMERTGLGLNDPTKVKSVTSFYPRIDGTGTVDISIGAELNPFQGVTYSPAVTFNIGQDNRVDCRVRGKFIAVKFENASSNRFRVSGYAFETESVSTR